MARTPARSSSTSLPGDGHLARLPERISPSRAKDYIQCPKLFYYKTILKISTPNTIATTRGTLAHSAFELIFDHDRPERTMENAVAYVRPAWKVLTDPFVSWEDVEPGTPEDLLRTGSGSFKELLKPRTKKAKMAKESADDYSDLVVREAAERTEALLAKDPDAPPVTPDEVEEELLSTAEDMVRNYFQMEKPEKFDPEGREIHVQATTMGVTLHGFIDRLDKFVTQDGRTKWYISDYKGLAVDTPLVTPTGWTTMGDVQVGDTLMGSDGRPTLVTAKSGVHDRPCYRVEFDDATSIVCDNVHLWQVQTGSGKTRTAPRVVDADELHRLAQRDDKGRRKPIIIVNAAALELPDADLPIDPYVLGSWLGDGHSKSGSITCGSQDLEATQSLLRSHGEAFTTREERPGVYTLTLSNRKPGLCMRGHERLSHHDCYTCQSTGRVSAPIFAPLSTRLRHENLLHNKRIPEKYLRGSIEQRLELLRGLMDTDGHWSPSRKQAVFVSTNSNLASGVAELCHSLGWRSSTATRDYTTKKGDRTSYSVSFTPFGYVPFSLERKASQVRAEGATRSKRRAVLAVVPVDSVPTQCVAVDSPDSLYLAGRQMVPTHNTGKVPGEGKNYRPETMRRIEEEAFFAMKVYALLFFEMHKIVPDELRLVYVKTGDRQTGIKTLQMTPAMVNSTRNQLSALWKGIKDNARKEEWPTKTGPLCNWCHFQSVCPAFTGGVEILLPEEVALRDGQEAEHVTELGLNPDPVAY